MGPSLTILGSGTAVPSLERGASGYLLQAGSDSLLFDTGPGTMHRLLEQGVGHDQVSHIFYTHNHIDHSGELASWLFTSRVPACARTTPLTIAGSPGFMALLASLQELYGHWVEASTYDLTLVTLDGSRRPEVAFGDWTIQAFPVNHIESSIGYRVTHASGRTFVYTGDTDLCDDLLPLARGADLLLIESSSPDGEKMPKHLTPSEAGEVARQAGAGKVVLTHFYPVCEKADMLGQLRNTYDGEGLLARDGLTVTV